MTIRKSEGKLQNLKTKTPKPKRKQWPQVKMKQSLGFKTVCRVLHIIIRKSVFVENCCLRWKIIYLCQVVWRQWCSSPLAGVEMITMLMQLPALDWPGEAAQILASPANINVFELMIHLCSINFPLTVWIMWNMFKMFCLCIIEPYPFLFTFTLCSHGLMTQV